MEKRPAENNYQPYTSPEMSNYNQAETKVPMTGQSVYPEIYYRLQPYVMTVCDQMDFENIEPNMDMVMQITDSIYDDVRRIYPDLAEYADNNSNEALPTIAIGPFPRMFRNRRRGIFRDIIDILLLEELSRRRRRRRFY